jgi:DNA polymerase-3 subunit alpha
MTEQDFYLRFKAEKGLALRGRSNDKEYVERLKTELTDISAMNFASYFLVVADYVGWAKKNDIPVGPGRGSGVGSLVAYSLGITDADPIKYGLLWERFLNRGRVSMPDFDIDFCMRRRSEVIEYVVAKYGAAQVAQIGTTGTMKARLAIRDTARALGLDPETIDRYGKLVPDEARGGQGDHAVTLAKCLAPDEAFIKSHQDQLNKFKVAYDRDKAFHDVINRAVEIEGVPKSIGTHAAGVVIWDQPLSSVVPLARTKEGLPATQWSDKEIESIGLVKYDFLGLRTLTVIDDIIKSIKSRTGVTINWDEVDENDPATFEMLSDGDTFGVFQLAENGMRGFTQQFKPSSIEDIATISALFRPGPLDNGMVSQILKVRKGETDPSYPIKAIEHILKPTNGVLTYQEQVLAIARAIAGYTLSEADLLRRAIGKKLPVEMAAQRAKFTEGMIAAGYSQSTAKDLFEVIERFADYCFNKSHAIAYSIISFRTAYLKRHYPADFYAANMSNWDELDKIGPIILDAKKHGVTVLCPDVNESGLNFTVVDKNTIRFGLTAVRGCGDSAISDLIKKRTTGPFKHLIDFCQRIDPTLVRKNNIIALIKGGAFDKIESSMNRIEMEEYAPDVIEASKVDQMSLKQNQMSMFGALFQDDRCGLVIRKPRIPLNQRAVLDAEKEVLGLHLSGSLLDEFAAIRETRDIDEVASLEVPDLYVTMLVMITEVAIRNGKRGQFAMITLEDESGSIPAKVWSNVFLDCASDIYEGACVVVTGRTNVYRGLEVVVDNIALASRVMNRTPKPVTINKLTFPLATKITSFSEGKIPIDLEIGAFRYRLGHFNLPEGLRIS